MHLLPRLGEEGGVGVKLLYRGGMWNVDVCMWKWIIGKDFVVALRFLYNFKWQAHLGGIRIHYVCASHRNYPSQFY